MEESVKQFIIEEHAKACSEWKQKIEEKYPELFINLLQKGKWYKLDTNFMFCFSGEYGNNTQYGFDLSGDWSEELGVHRHRHYTPATNEEVQDALIAEAKRQGFSQGVDFKLIRGAVGQKNCEKITSKFHLKFDEEENELVWTSLGVVYTIFKDGEWATVIREEKPQLISKIEDILKAQELEVTKMLEAHRREIKTILRDS